MTARIVVGVDGSAEARRALEFAVEEARRRVGEIDAVFAYPSTAYYPGTEFGLFAPPPREAVEKQAMQTLRHALDQVPDDIIVHPIVVEGPAAHALLDAAKDADLLVVGSRGRGGFAGLLLGSTSHQVVSHARCPVVVVPSPSEPTEDEA